jgi:glycosyltransferase involved in cell wall biosynthesis
VRILVVSPFLPYPPLAGGHAQIWSWLRHLPREHEVAFVGFYEREEEAPGLQEIERLCAAARARLRCPTPHAYTSFAQLPMWVTEFYSGELAGDLREVARSFQPSVVLFASTNMAQYRRCVGRAAVAVCALEIGFVACRRRIEAARGFDRLRARLDWLRMLRYETAVFRRADHVVAVSDRDAEIIRAVAPGARVTAVPPGVDEEQLAPRHRNPIPATVLYVGHMEHYPNLDGLLYLFREIWPRVRAQAPEARLIVAGRGAREELARVAPEALAAMDADRSVELAGFVPDLRALMDRTAALAAPLRLGGGVRNKVIESLAAGLPVVTTARGAEGLAVARERELLIADAPQEFATQLVRLLRDQTLQARLAAAGRALAARDHGNDELARRLARALAQAAGARA